MTRATWYARREVMITRKILDEALPDLPSAFKAMRNIDPKFNFNEDTIFSYGLRWLAEATERNRHPTWDVKWKHPDSPEYDPSEMMWPISMGGLEYKQTMSYLTAQGWPSGAPCWFVCIECGYREFVGALLPELAIARAIVVFKIIELQQDIAPKRRAHLVDALREIGEEVRTGDCLPTSPLIRRPAPITDGPRLRAWMDSKGYDE